MIGAQAVVASLEAEGVDVVFGYPGGQAIKIYDALYDSKQLRHVLARHEQGAVHEADGYARATGRRGRGHRDQRPRSHQHRDRNRHGLHGLACLWSSSPGQVPRGVIGTDSFQESDIVGITMPVVKHSYLLAVHRRAHGQTFREAFHIASTGRPRPRAHRRSRATLPSAAIVVRVSRRR